MDRRNIKKDLEGRWRFNSEENQIERSNYFFERRAYNTERGKAGSISSNAGRFFIAKIIEGSKLAVIRMRYSKYNKVGRPHWYGCEKLAKNAAEKLPGEWQAFKAPADNSRYFKDRAYHDPHALQWFWRLPEDKDKDKSTESFAAPPVIRVWGYVATGVAVYGPSSMDGMIVGSVLNGSKKIPNLKAVMDGLIDIKDLQPRFEDKRNEEAYNAKWGVDEKGEQKHWYHAVRWPDPDDGNDGGEKNKSIRKNPVGRSSTSIAELQKLIDNS